MLHPWCDDVFHFFYDKRYDTIPLKSPVHTRNNVEATLSNATSWTILSTVSNVASTKSNVASTMLPVASTLLLVWTGLTGTWYHVLYRVISIAIIALHISSIIYVCQWLWRRWHVRCSLLIRLCHRSYLNLTTFVTTHSATRVAAAHTKRSRLTIGHRRQKQLKGGRTRYFYEIGSETAPGEGR